MKYFSYLNTAIELTGSYQGQQPFHLFIKEFFRQHKKYGSTDRKQITHLCYCWFRLGPWLREMPAGERMLIALFLCTDQNNPVLAHIKPEWNAQIDIAIEAKCALLQLPLAKMALFPYPEEVSNSIDKKKFVLSHFKQPDVFLRIRPGQLQRVQQKLEQAALPFSLLEPNCIRLPNASKIDQVIAINKEAVVQDYSSQRTGHFLQLVEASAPLKIWDCCAASGGKSILAKDVFTNIDLTVSDIRKSVMINLVKRFEEAGIRHYKTLITDLAAPGRLPPVNSFDLVIADLPCTGSGTWGRTPERLSSFDVEEIDNYHRLQQKIIETVMPCLKTNGFFLYITCSVFTKENEDIVQFIKDHFPVREIENSVIKGYEMKADTMFAALFRKV